MSGPAFTYARARDAAEAVALAARPGALFVAGGTDLLQLWQAGAATPAQVVDISRLPLAEIAVGADGLVLGATARLADVAAHPAVGAGVPLIAQAILAGASGQVRNMATIGGNLLQRTRCPYFRSRDLPCNKRVPGSGCGAREGENRIHALFGASAACVATHPSDLAVALAALDAEVAILSEAGTRSVAIGAFYRLPGDAPERDTVLAPGDLVTGVRVAPFAGRCTYLKVRDRASFEFAVISVAACLRVEDGVVAAARLAAGGVAPMPWRLHGAEAALTGLPAGPAAFAAAGEAAVAGAAPLAHNGFKVALLRRAVVRALETVGGRA